MFSRKRVIYKCVALIGATSLVLFLISRRASSKDGDVPRLMGRENTNDLQAFPDVLRSRGKTGGQQTTRTFGEKGRLKDYAGLDYIGHEEQNEWINSAQLNLGLQINSELRQGEKAHLPQENVGIVQKRISQEEWKVQMPVLMDGEHFQDESDRTDGSKRDGAKLGENPKDAAGEDNIGKEGILDAFVKEGIPEVAKLEAVPDKHPTVTKNKTTDAKTTRKRVRVIRKTMRNGKVIHEEVVGIKTVISNATKTVVKGKGKILTYEDIWYRDILNGNFRADPVQLENKTRGSPYLTEKLWRFRDTNSERLFLYEKLLQHGWRRNLTNLVHLRQELHESGIDAENNLIVTQENAPLGASLPFYISTKIPVGNTTERRPGYNVTSEFRKHIPEDSPFRGRRYKRCAVVGNSGSLLHSGCGPEIDNSDMIFRCNAAPIVKYGHDAGWKSNITTFNPSIFYRRFNALQKWEDYLRFKENITQYSGYIWLACFGSAALHNVCLTPVLAGSSRKPNEPQLVLSNPNQFVNFWEFWKMRNISKTPSTGFFMTHAALELCEETHLYGFWPFPLRLDTGFERVPYHYFDDLVVSKRHGMSDEFSVFLQYHELGILRLHTGKCRSEKT